MYVCICIYICVYINLLTTSEKNWIRYAKAKQQRLLSTDFCTRLEKWTNKKKKDTIIDKYEISSIEYVCVVAADPKEYA